MGVALRRSESAYKQTFEIILDLKRFSLWRTRKSWWIEDDSIELFTSAGEPRKHRSYIVRNETMIEH